MSGVAFDFDGTEGLRPDEVIEEVIALIPDFLGTEGVVRAGGPAAGGNSGQGYFFRWSTSEFPPQSQVSLTLSNDVALISIARTRAVE